MTFGSVLVADAAGGILAHSLHHGDLRLRKGRVLTKQDIAALRAAGVAHVTVAMLSDDDIEENVAAGRVAQALVNPQDQQVELTTPFTGRVNVIAKVPGVARIDVATINALNACDPMITCATVAPFARLEPGGLIATIKIISYGVPASAVDQAEAIGAGIGLSAATLKSARLIVTETGAEVSPEKGVASVKGRLDALGIDLAEVVMVRHDAASIAAALKNVSEDLALILTASATSDIADVAPEAVRHAGGKIERFGMPVDPGNLLFIGKLLNCPVIGLPGCARSPALNGADWVLERIACGCDVSGDDIAAMGVGGLLKEIPQRPQPRRGTPRP